MTQWVLLGVGLLSIQACGWWVQWACRFRHPRVRATERWSTSWLLGLGVVTLGVFAWVQSGGPVSAWVFRSFGTAAVVATALGLIGWRVWYVHVPTSTRQKVLLAVVAAAFLACLPMCAAIPTAARHAPPGWLLHLPDGARVGTDDVTALARWYVQPGRFPHAFLLPMAHTYLYVWMGRIDPDAVAVVLALTWVAMVVLLHAKVTRHGGERAAALAVLLAIVHLALIAVPRARAGSGDDLVFAALFSAGTVYLWSWMHSAVRSDSRLGALLLALSVLADKRGAVAAGTIVIGLGLYALLSRRRSMGVHVARVAVLCLLTGGVWLVHCWAPAGSGERLSAATSASHAHEPTHVRGPAWVCFALVGVALVGTAWWRRGRFRRPRNVFLAWVLAGYVAAVAAMPCGVPIGICAEGPACAAQVLVHVMPCAILLLCSLQEQPTRSDLAPPADHGAAPV